MSVWSLREIVQNFFNMLKEYFSCMAPLLLPSPFLSPFCSFHSYRKIAGDACEGGIENLYNPFEAPCCGNSTLPPTPHNPTDETPTTFSSPSSSSSPPSSFSITHMALGLTLAVATVAALVFFMLFICMIV